MRKHKALLPAMVFCAILLCGVSWARVERSELLLKSLQKKYSAIRSLEGNFKMVLQGVNGSSEFMVMNATGKVYAEDHRFRMETIMRVSNPYQAKTMKMRGLFVFSNNVLWEMVTPAAPAPGAAFLGKLNVSSLRKSYPNLFGERNFLNFLNPAAAVTQLDGKDLRFLGEVFLGLSKTKTAVLVSSPQLTSQALAFPVPGAGSAPAKMEVWVGIRDGIAYRTALINRNGKESMRFSFVTVKKNVRLSRSLFEFHPPGGLEVTDMAPLMKEMMTKERKRPGKKGKGQ